MPIIKEVVDSKAGLISSNKSDPAFPTIEKMRESQKAGSEGNGTQPCSMPERAKETLEQGYGDDPRY